MEWINNKKNVEKLLQDYGELRHIEIRNNGIVYSYHNSTLKRISYNDLANLCKLKASELGFGLASWVEQGEDGACELKHKNKNIEMMFKDDTEAEATFKAYEWILNNID